MDPVVRFALSVLMMVIFVLLVSLPVVLLKRHLNRNPEVAQRLRLWLNEPMSLASQRAKMIAFIGLLYVFVAALVSSELVRWLVGMSAFSLAYVLIASSLSAVLSGLVIQGIWSITGWYLNRGPENESFFLWFSLLVSFVLLVGIPGVPIITTLSRALTGT